ncbi:putative spermidine/putrescine transport system ATP-binding protein [Gemmobacter megaterium]|uniref:Putative spermidine/putrescine transport system ATP-binding protein n=1 Tax=Gemmobacter megaterium TaxID=1086013 RepID=A0A1N7KGS3_9RHOB|nr:ABC transporter ATP-binding protein [Gemmobacter megaterium]GGE02073.1 polyamine-transporting ATPase [Gemmobacter megaterium]SIS60773.1 putative spermidine/putrescine transport system ATP-binding protein [Gemmobacter megaterium]
MTSESRQNKLLLEGLSKRYGSFTALEPTSLAVEDGEFLTLLGPSGSGKTTLLQMVSGLAEPTSGRLWVDGEDWTHRPVNQRGMGLVFQHYALFPHMTVAENVAFPLQMRKLSGADLRARVDETLKKVQLDSFAHRYPKELSGGQQQRVALARCFVFRPRLILMDEPLGALDKSLREHMQLEIRRLHKEFGTTVIYVTHDQEEALVMSDRICVMNHARVEQLGTPRQIYSDPETLFAATFIGHSNVLRGKRISADESQGVIRTAMGEFHGGYTARDRSAEDVALIVRPEHMRIGPAPSAEFEGLSGRVHDLVYVGAETRLLLMLSDGSEIMLRHDPGIGAQPAIGDMLPVHWARSVARIVA